METQVIIDTIANAPNVECEAMVIIIAFMLIYLSSKDNSSVTVGQINKYSDSGGAVNLEWTGRTEHIIESIVTQNRISFFNHLHINIFSSFHIFFDERMPSRLMP